MIGDGLQFKETSAGLEIRVHVLPRAKRNEILGLHNGALKVKITAPPVDDAANRAIIEYFSQMLGIPKSAVSIPTGTKSRDKTLQIRGVSLQALLDCLVTQNPSKID